MNALSLPFKGTGRVGMGEMQPELMEFTPQSPHPPPSRPLEGAELMRNAFMR